MFGGFLGEFNFCWRSSQPFFCTVA